MIRKLINEGELQSFRIGVLIRTSAAEVERYEKCPAEPTSPIPSNASGEVSPSSGGSSPRMTQKRNRKGTVGTYIGRQSCRERAGMYEKISVVAVYYKTTYTCT